MHLREWTEGPLKRLSREIGPHTGGWAYCCRDCTVRELTRLVRVGRVAIVRPWPGLPRDQFSGPWLFRTAEARTSNSSASCARDPHRVTGASTGGTGTAVTAAAAAAGTDDDDDDDDDAGLQARERAALNLVAHAKNFSLLEGQDDCWDVLVERLAGSPRNEARAGRAPRI